MANGTFFNKKFDTCEELGWFFYQFLIDDSRKFHQNFIDIHKEILLITCYNDECDLEVMAQIDINEYLKNILLNEFVFEKGDCCEWGYRFNFREFVEYFIEYEARKRKEILDKVMEKYNICSNESEDDLFKI